MSRSLPKVEVEELGVGVYRLKLNNQKIGEALRERTALSVARWLNDALSDIDVAIRDWQGTPRGPVKAGTPSVGISYPVDGEALALGSQLLADYRKKHHGG